MGVLPDEFREIIDKPLKALDTDRRSRIAATRLELAKFVVEMTYKYKVTDKKVMDDIEKVMRRYNGEKVK